MSGIKKNQQGAGLLQTIIVIAIIAVVAFTGWLVYHNHHKKTTPVNNMAASQNSTKNQWNTYKNTKYGFQFSYPDSWGKPVLSTPQTQSGLSYSISFPSHTKRDNVPVVTSIYMDSNNASATKSAIQSQLKQTSFKPTVSGSTSYAVVANAPGQAVSGLSLYQIVSITKLGISGVTVNYQVTDSGHSCPQSQFSSDSNCVIQTDYDTLSKIAKSLQNL